MISPFELLRRAVGVLQINAPPPEPPLSKLKQISARVIQLLPKSGRGRMLLAGAVLAVIAIVGVITYNHFKRPDDVLNKNAAFESENGIITRGVVDWPTYGFDNERTRYLCRKGIRPPFKRRWEYASGALMEFSPILAKERIFGVNNAGLAFSLDAKTGELNWDRKIADLNASSPAFHDGRLFLVNLQPGEVQALDADTGKELWRKSLPGRSESSPAVVDGKVIFGCECGTMYALDESTGKTVWERDLGSAIKGGPAVSDGVAYVGDYGGSLSAINIDDGTVKWQSSSQGLSLGRAGSFYATPAVSNGRVYIGSKDGRMYSFEADTGKLAWSHSTGSEVYSSVAVADTAITDATVYFGNLAGDVYALDARDGHEVWKQSANGSVIGAGAVIGQVYYVSSVSHRNTSGFATKGGKKVFGAPFGAYNTPISDGKQIYFSTYGGVLAMKVRPGGGLTKDQKAEFNTQVEKAKAERQKSRDRGKKAGHSRK